MAVVKYFLKQTANGLLKYCFQLSSYFMFVPSFVHVVGESACILFDSVSVYTDSVHVNCSEVWRLTFIRE